MSEQSKPLKYTVIRDTREKPEQGWYFPGSTRCSGTLVQKLDVGDYTIGGLEKIVAIERKGSVAEFCSNLTQERFVGGFDSTKSLNRQSEFIRLEAIQYPYLLLEFTVDELIKYPNIPEVPYKLRSSIRFTGPAALKKVIELEMIYKTRIVFCGTRGKDVASSIFKRVIEEIERKNGGSATS